MDPLSSLYKLARKNMVLNQLKAHNLTHPALVNAFLSIARERFVPPAFYNLCYYDDEIKLSSGRVLLSPVTLARLLQEANPIPGQKALIVGGGTGYSAAVLSLCGVDCYMVESESLLFEQAAHLLASFENVHCLSDDLINGWAEYAPYDIILMDGGAVSSVPLSIFQQLNPAKGRLFAMLCNQSEVATLNYPLCQAVCAENPESTETRILFECSIPVNSEWSTKNGDFVF